MPIKEAAIKHDEAQTPPDMTRGNVRVGHLAKPTCECLLCEKIVNW